VLLNTRPAWQDITGPMDNMMWTALANVTNWPEHDLFEVLSVDTQPGIPQQFNLSQNYPNPFNPSTTISYEIPTAAHVSLVVYDVIGREVVRLIDGRVNAGTQQIRWNGLDSDGSMVPSGIYVARLNNGIAAESIKMLLLK